MEIRKLKEKSRTLEVSCRIGKNGINDNVISELNRLLRKKHMIKIKLLKGLFDVSDKNKDELAQELAQKTNAILVERIGFVVVLFKDGIYKHSEN